MSGQRWEPDSHLIPAAQAGPKCRLRMSDLPYPDRAWLVAGLTLAGLTAKEIAERLSCSLRLVRTIRADDMTHVCLLAQRREASLADALRKMELEYRLARIDLDAQSRTLRRMETQLDQVVAAHLDGTMAVFPRCRHPKVGYNVYRHGGREYCRECRRDWDQTRRNRQSENRSVPA